jgi:hypothetical protein
MDVFNSPTCSLAKFKAELGELKVKALLVWIIADFVQQFNVGKTMNDKQIGRVTELILDEFYFLKPDDFKLCFNDVIKGKYGTSYDRVDAQVICNWLRQYVNERMEVADHQNYQIHISEKNKPIELSQEVIERLQRFTKPKEN